MPADFGPTRDPEPTTPPDEAGRGGEQFEEGRREQAAQVMPLLGPLLDALDGMSNDARASLCNEHFGFCRALTAVRDAMERDHANP